MEEYGSGPGLEQPRGDIGRQAVAALRGYAYQIYVSALAWIGLADQELLFLEVAEDFAVATRDALAGTQVRDTAGSGRLTLQSASTREALDSFVDLTSRNPGRTVSLHYLTTSEIGTEQRVEHRIEGGAALLYWRKAAAGLDVAPLRALIGALNLKSETHQFLNALSDEAFRSTFLARIHWHCGAPGIQDVRAELEAGLIEYVTSARRLSSSVGRELLPAVVELVLLKAVSVQERQLRRADLLALIDELSRVSVPIEQLAAAFSGGTSSFARPSLLLPLTELTIPTPCAPRRDLVATIDAQRRTSGAVIVVGATGLGKSLVARLVADPALAGWSIADFRDLNAADTAARLALLSGEIAAAPPTGLILDDLNEADDPRVRDLLSRLLMALRRRDATAIITAYRTPAPTTLHGLGPGGLPIIEIPYLEVEEVGDLINQAGGDLKFAGHVHRASAGGHPQLAMALIQSLSGGGWSRAALARLLGQDAGEELAIERRAARQRLMGALSAEASTLLVRASLIGGQFDRGMAISLGEIDPPVPMAGGALDNLIGAWIETLSRDHMRVSPLIDGAAAEMLTETECRAIHHRIADRILTRSNISVFEIDLLTRHALRSGDGGQAIALADAVIKSSEEMLETIAPFTGALQRLPFNRPILPNELAISAMLRLAQLLLLVQKASAVDVRGCWEAVLKEGAAVAGPKLFESLAYSKLLIQSRTSSHFEDWVDLLVRFDRLTVETPELAAANRNFASVKEGAPHVTGVMFASQVSGISTVAKFRAFMERIDRESGEFRERCFSSFRRGRADLSILVNHGWLKESPLPAFDWDRAAADYDACAELAMAWQHPELAVRCAIARAICIDENGDQKERALASLQEAEQRFGFDIALARARAKIHWRRRDHAEALPLLAAASNEGGQDPLERAYIAREAGISAAALGDWREARGWFERSHEAAVLLEQPTVRAMAIGLLADIGHSAALSGDIPYALEKMREAVLALPSIDPDGTLHEAYCHRIIRHAALWLQLYVTERQAPEDYQIVYQAGSGSNTEPLEAIRSHPLAPIDFAFYMLAEADRTLKQPTGYYRRFRDDLTVGPILQSEGSFLVSIGMLMIARHQTEEFVDHLRRIASLGGFFEWLQGLDEKTRMLDPPRGRIEAASIADGVSDETRERAEDFLLSFAIVSALAGEFGALDEAIDACLVVPEVDALRPILERMKGDIREFTKEREIIAITVNALRNDNSGTPEELVWAGVWLLMHARATKWKDLVVPPTTSWIFEQWEDVLRYGRFALVMPALNVPAIEAAITDPDRSLSAAARLTLAAVPAAGTVLTQPVRGIITELAEQRPAGMKP